MNRLPVCLISILCFVLLISPAGAERLNALEIFEGMFYYENDQLDSVSGINDYTCMKTETTVMAGSPSRSIVDKELFYMVPGFYIQLIDGNPAFYMDVAEMASRLQFVQVERLRDAEIDGVDCYVIRMEPNDPAYSMYTKTYYVSQEDFRKVRTISVNANDEYDNMTTEINYTYGEVDRFLLILEETAVWHGENGNEIATVTSEYTDYEFGVGLTEEFFASHRENRDIVPPQT